MTNEIHRGVVRGGMVVLLEDDMPLMEGTQVLVTSVPASAGAPSTVLAAMESLPKVPAAWVDELEQLIVQGRRPPNRKDPFQENQ